MAWFSKLVGQGGGGGLAYDLGQSVPFSASSVWSLHEGKRKSDGSLVSVFSCELTTLQPAHKLAVENALKRFKTLRHPNLLVYVDGAEVGTTLYLVTERVRPLNVCLDEFRQRPDALAYGLHCLASGLAFLNDSCKLAHGFVVPSSVFVTRGGDWRLGGHELVSDVSDPDCALTRAEAFLPVPYLSPELENAGSGLPAGLSPSAIDAWQLGVLMYHVWNDKPTSAAQLRGVGAIPLALQEEYRGLISPAINMRMSPSRLLKAKYFDNPVVSLMTTLESLSVQEQQAKDAFFRSLPQLLPRLTPDTRQYKLLPTLLTALEYGAANATALAPILAIAEDLSKEDFQSQILPRIVKLFGSNDRAVRISLLQRLGAFSEHLPDKLVNDTVFPALCTGFMDTSAALRELTVKSVLVLAPRLNDRNLNKDLLKYLAKLQVDQVPGIRANVTVCLGKMASHMSESVREKVLVPSFTRGVRDPFPPARVSALMALGATVAHYTPATIAARVLPTVCPLTVDPVTDVRTAAFSCIDSLLVRLRTVSDEVAARDAAAAAAEAASHGVSGGAASGTTTSSPTLSTHSAPAAAAAAGAVSGAGSSASSAAAAAGKTALGLMLGGLSVAANRIVGDTPPAQQQQQQQQQSTPISSTVSAPARFPVTSATAEPAAAPATDGWDDFAFDDAAGSNGTTAAAAAAAVAAPAASDGWDDFNFDAPAAAPAPSFVPAQQAATATRATTAAPVAAAPAGDTGSSGGGGMQLGGGSTRNKKAKLGATKLDTAVSFAEDEWDDW